MKKTILSIAVIAAAIFAASCQKESLQDNAATEGSASVFTATIETGAGTKTTVERVDGVEVIYKTKWENTDQISINGVTYTATPDGTDATKATFAKNPDTQTDPTGPFNAYFPANLYNNGTPTLPANVSEEWADGKYNMPMYATSPTTSLSFRNLCGVLKITVTNAQLSSVKCITVSSTNCATSGAFNVTDKKAVLTAPSNTANTVTVTYTEAVTTDATGKVFYVAIPAQTYKNLSIAVSDGTTNKVMTTKKDQDITVARNTVYPIAFNGQPIAGTAKRTGDIDVKWVQLWEEGPKFAEYNVGQQIIMQKITAAIIRGAEHIRTELVLHGMMTTTLARRNSLATTTPPPSSGVATGACRQVLNSRISSTTAHAPLQRKMAWKVFFAPAKAITKTTASSFLPPATATTMSATGTATGTTGLPRLLKAAARTNCTSIRASSTWTAAAASTATPSARCFRSNLKGAYPCPTQYL